MRPSNRSRRGFKAVMEPLETRQVLSTLYVDPLGNDANKGTASAPFKTLQKAAKVVAPGDTVDVRAGTYAGFIMGWDRPQTGTADKPIVFHAEPGVVINSRNNKTPDGIDLEGVSYITIDGFSISGMNRAGIRSTWGQNVIISNNVTDSNARWGIYTSHDDNVLVQNNTASNSRLEHGIYISNACKNPTVRGNISFNNAGCGIHMNGGLLQGGDGMISGAVIENNTIYNNGTRGGSGINMDGVRNSVIRNNLLYNNHASGISIYRIDAGGPAINDTVSNNTIVMASDAKFPLNIQNGSTGTQVFNNILLTNNPKKPASFSISSDSLSGLVSDYNALMPQETTDGYNFMKHSVWQSKTGQDAHSFAATPSTLGFVNPTAADYHLSLSSAAVDSGSTVWGSLGLAPPVASSIIPPVDLGGNARVQGLTIDMGAYETTPAPPPVVSPSILKK